MNTLLASRLGRSLLEVLAVFAVLACLIGLLLPAIQSARAAAVRTTCMNNLRQIGLGVHSHRAANDGRFPEPNWPEQIAPHLGGAPLAPSRQLFLCPADVPHVLPDGSVAGSYGMNTWLVGRTRPIPDGDGNTASHCELSGARLGVRYEWGAEIGDIAPDLGPHGIGSGVSVLFADGHVRVIHTSATQEILNSLIDPADGLPISVE